MDNVTAMMVLSPLFMETLDRFGIDYIHYGIIMVMVIEFGFPVSPVWFESFRGHGADQQELDRGFYRRRAISYPFADLSHACYLHPVNFFVPAQSVSSIENIPKVF